MKDYKQGKNGEGIPVFQILFYRVQDVTSGLLEQGNSNIPLRRNFSKRIRGDRKDEGEKGRTGGRKGRTMGRRRR